MALADTGYTIGTSSTTGDIAGVSHWKTVNRPHDVAVRPPAAVRTPYGDNPATSVGFTWDGGDTVGGDPTWQAFAVGTSHRAERALAGSAGPNGQANMPGYTAGVIWHSFALLCSSNVKDSLNGDDNWNYIFQHRSELDEAGGGSPSPSPALGLMDGYLIFVIRTPTRDISWKIGALDKGGDWHYYRVGYYWTASTSLSIGWWEAWRDGKQNDLTLEGHTRVSGRTALRTTGSASAPKNVATMRWGGYREPSLVGRTDFNLWGYANGDTDPGDFTGYAGAGGGGTGEGGGGGTTRPDLVLPTELAFPAAERVGTAPATAAAWFGASVDSSRGSTFTLQACEADEAWIPLRGSLAGSGSQSFKVAIYSVSNINDPLTDVLVVTSNEISVPTTSEALYYVFSWTRRAFTAGTYRMCLISSTNAVVEYLRNPTGQLAWRRDTYSDGPANPFGSQSGGIGGIDPLGLVGWFHAEPAAVPPSGPVPLQGTLIGFGDWQANATELGGRTAIDPENVVYRLTQTPTEYIIPTAYDKTTDAELEWDADDQAFYQVETAPGG